MAEPVAHPPAIPNSTPMTGNDPKIDGSKTAEPIEPVEIAKPALPDKLAVAAKLLQDQPINLLKLIDISQHTVSGKWQLANDVLTADASAIGQLELPFAVPEQYELAIDVAGIRGENGIVIGLPIAGRHVVVVIDGWSARASGIEVLDGRPADRNETAVYGRTLFSDKPNVVRCLVGKASIRVIHNEQTLVDWQGDVARLTFPDAYERPRQSSIFLASNTTAFQVTRLELTPHSPLPRGPVALADLDSARAPVPDDAALAQAKTIVFDVFQESIDQAKTSPDKLAVAKQLVAQGRDVANNDAGTRFVMLQTARDLVVDADDLGQGLAIVDELARRFEIDRLKAKSELFEAMKASPKTREALVAFTETIVSMIDEAIDSDEFGVAANLLKSASGAASLSRDRDLQRKVANLRQEVGELESMWQEFGGATAALKADPHDPAANLARGRYLCLVKGRWRIGLRSLAKTADKELLVLVQRDLAQPTELLDQLKLADDWWTWTQADAAHKVYQAFPHYWYRRTLPELAGLAKIKAEKRLEQIGTPRKVRPIEQNR